MGRFFRYTFVFVALAGAMAAQNAIAGIAGETSPPVTIAVR
jgi:hypothetical protein